MLMPGRRRVVSRLMAGWLVCALLWAQLLGVVHQEIHPAISGPAHQHTQTATSAVRVALERLLGHHDDGIHAADCRLYDQLSHADAMPAHVPALALPPLWPAVLLVTWGSHALPTYRAWFEARGPPYVC